MNHDRITEYTGESTAALVSDEVLKHNYRNIKIAPGMTVTVDVEELKERQRQEIYKHLYQHLYPFQSAT